MLMTTARMSLSNMGKITNITIDSPDSASTYKTIIFRVVRFLQYSSPPPSPTYNGSLDPHQQTIGIWGS